MTNTIEQDLFRPTARRPRVELREPIRLLSQAICVVLATLGLDPVDADESEPADVRVWAIDASTTGDQLGSGGPPLVALVEGADEPAVRRLYAAGARAVLDRGSDPEVIVATAVAVANGLVVIQPEYFLPLVGTGPLLLDRDELRWMRSLATGQHMNAIAHREGHSERDMYRKFKGVYAKLGVSGRAEALVLLARADLLSERRA